MKSLGMAELRTTSKFFSRKAMRRLKKNYQYQLFQNSKQAIQ